MSEANPTDDTQIVNVKEVRRNSWKAAKDLADKRDETMGSLVSRAIDQLIRVEAAGPGAIVEIKPANLVPKNETVKLIPRTANTDMLDLIELIKAAAALPEIKAVPGLRSLLAERVRQARGLPPPKPRTPPRGALALPNGAGEGA